jgi:hypothetical protein
MSGANLRVQGARFTAFIAPLPLRLSLTAARHSRVRDARPGSRSRRGKGGAPAPSSLRSPAARVRCPRPTHRSLATQGSAGDRCLEHFGAFIRVPPSPMKLFSTKGTEPFKAALSLFLDRLIQSAEPIAVFEVDRIRIGLFNGIDQCDGCNEVLHWIAIEFLTDEGWKPILCVDERNYPLMMTAFDQVRDRLEKAH